MQKENYHVFEKLVRDALVYDGSVFTVSNGTAVCEAKIDANYPLTISDGWATIGNEKKQWHMHLNLADVTEARFIEEPGCGGQSYSLRFCNSKGEFLIRIYFSDTTDNDGKIITNKKSKYDEMVSKYEGRKSIALQTGITT